GYVDAFRSELGNCRPSCYDREPASWGKPEDVKEVCGYIDYGFDSMMVGGKWTPLNWLGESTDAPTELKSCKIPADSGGSWAALAKQARTSFDPNFPKDTSFVVTPGTDWS